MQVCVCLGSRICVQEWWQRQTICSAESGPPCYGRCLGVAAPQMFWLFLAQLCFWFPLVCLKLRGLDTVHDGTFEEVLVKSALCLSIKLSLLAHLSSNTDSYEVTYLCKDRKENARFFFFIAQIASWDFKFFIPNPLISMTFITLLPFKCHFLVWMMTFHHLKKKNLFVLFILCEACSSCLWNNVYTVCEKARPLVLR